MTQGELEMLFKIEELADIAGLDPHTQPAKRSEFCAKAAEIIEDLIGEALT